MLITILYAIWIAYTVGSLSVITFIAITAFFANKETKKRNERINNLLKARPNDERDWYDM